MYSKLGLNSEFSDYFTEDILKSLDCIIIYLYLLLDEIDSLFSLGN